MFLLRLANFIRGYIIISVEGYFLERFLNICTNRNIFLWDIKRRGTTKMTACISIAGFKRIATIAYKSRCRVKIIKRAGLPFIVSKHKKRYAFSLGVCLFFCLIFIMSSFIWGIEISGIEKIDENTVRQLLYENGLKIGMLKNMVDVDAVRSKMMTNMPEIAWIGIYIIGSKAEVEIKERIQKPDIVEKDKPYNIKAKCDGVITRIEVKQGMPLVKQGDVVTKGQLLVSGVLESSVVGVRLVPSSAIILAKTWHEKSAPILGYTETQKRTGKVKSKHILRVFNVNINLFLDDKVPFEKFERSSFKKQLALSPNLLLPFSFHYDKFYEVEVIREEINEEQAYQNTAQMLYKQLDEEIAEDDIKVLNRYETKKVNENNEPILKVTYECEESIVEMEEAMYEPYRENS